MTTNSDDIRFLTMAIEEASDNIRKGGGPFGAVIVKEGEVISLSGNRVVPDNDPTAHAEVAAIRLAASKLGTFDLSGCIMYASCEPCPMCLGAIYWSGIRRIVYSSDRFMAAEAGFNDEFIYKEIALNNDERSIEMTRQLIAEGMKVFEEWENFQDKVRY